MKPLKIFKLILFLLVSLSSISQLTLGEATLMYKKAQPLLRSEALATGLKSVTYLSKTGGVAFDKVAIPADGLSVSQLQLKYHSSKEDGKRFSVIINGMEAQADIYDWELVPIAKYANSSYTACFTLFGDLENDTQTESVLRNGGRVLNYHPELANTLLGLRLFQLDILIVYPNLTIDLPKKSNQYLLGKGEQSPDILSNRLGYQRFKTNLEKTNQEYRSYLICDQNRSIKFGVQNNSLFITGQPFYYFWQYNTEQASFQKKILKDLTNESTNIKQQGTTLSEKNALLERWLLSEVHKEFQKFYGASYQTEYNAFNLELRNIKSTKGQESYMSELFYTVYELRIENAPNKEIVYLKNLSTTFSSQSELFKNINPAVWNAGVKTMRFSAFFRYCKTYFPEQWKNFMAQIKRIEITPVVTTPAVMSFKGK